MNSFEGYLWPRRVTRINSSSVVAPWTACLLASWIFSYLVMTDADLGKENEETEEGLDV